MALAIVPIVGAGQSCDATSELYFYLPPGEAEGEIEISDWDTYEYITIHSDLDEVHVWFLECDTGAQRFTSANTTIHAVCQATLEFPDTLKHSLSIPFGESVQVCRSDNSSGDPDVTMVWSAHSPHKTEDIVTTCILDPTIMDDPSTEIIELRSSFLNQENSQSIQNPQSETIYQFYHQRSEWFRIELFGEGETIICTPPLSAESSPHSGEWHPDNLSISKTSSSTRLDISRSSAADINDKKRFSLSWTHTDTQGNPTTLDSLRFTKIRNSSGINQLDSCGCNGRAYNQNSGLPYHGLCQWTNWDNIKRFNYNHFIDRHGQVFGHNNSPAPLPADVEFRQLGRYGSAALSTEGELWHNNVLLASGVISFDMETNGIHAIDSSLVHKTWSFNGTPLTQNQVALEPDALPKELVVGYRIAYFELEPFLLDDKGHIYHIDTSADLVEMPYQGSYIDIDAGLNVLYGITTDGRAFSHEFRDPYISWFDDVIPNLEDGEDVQGEIVGIHGTGRYFVSFRLENGRQKVIYPEGLVDSPFAQYISNVPHLGCRGWQGNSDGVYMDIDGSIRSGNGALVAHGSIITNWGPEDELSIVSPSQTVTCQDTTACNYGATECCIYIPIENLNRMASSGSSSVAIQPDSTLKAFTRQAGGETSLSPPYDTMQFIEVHAGINWYLGSAQDQYTFGLDTSRILHVIALIDSLPPNPFLSSIPSSHQNVPLQKVFSFMGGAAALKPNGDFVVWGIGNQVIEGNSENPGLNYFEHHRSGVSKFNSGIYCTTIEYSTETSEIIAHSSFANMLSPFMAGISGRTIRNKSVLSNHVIYENGQIAKIGGPSFWGTANRARYDSINDLGKALQSGFFYNNLHYAQTTDGKLYNLLADDTDGGLFTIENRDSIAGVASLPSSTLVWHFDGTVERAYETAHPYLDSVYVGTYQDCDLTLMSQPPCDVDTDMDGICETLDACSDTLALNFNATSNDSCKYYCMNAPVFTGLHLIAPASGIDEADATVSLEITAGSPTEILLEGLNGTADQIIQIDNPDSVGNLPPGSYNIFVMDADSCLGVAQSENGSTFGQLAISYPIMIPFELCCGSCGVFDVDTDGICDDQDNCTDKLASNYSDPSNSICLFSGCTNPDYLEYSPLANNDDGTCTILTCAASAPTMDGYTYEVVEIGNQCWFSENLRTTVYRTGETIPLITSAVAWELLEQDSLAACTYPGGLPAYVSDFGLLYNFYAVNESGSICPTGWHVSTLDDWHQLETEIGLTPEGIIPQGASLLKATPFDNPAWNGTNTSDFSAIPAGAIGHNFSISSFNDYGYWWTSTLAAEVLSPNAYGAIFKIMKSDTDEINEYDSAPSSNNIGLSVRCIRD